jgi:hypothetical protein
MSSFQMNIAVCRTWPGVISGSPSYNQSILAVSSPWHTEAL